MSLLGSLQLANNSLIASQLGLQVVGNNIANANTPGYIRQELNLVTAPPQKLGDLTLGLGVQAHSVTQRIDRFLEDRLRSSISDLSNSETQESTYTQLETIIGQLGDGDLSSNLTDFFNSVQDILNQPESVSVRNIAVLKGQTLTQQIKELDGRVRTLQQQTDDQIAASGDKINGMLQKIAELNVKIVRTEGGTVSRSDAVGLRDQREMVLKDLANVLRINSVEQPNGDVTVFLNGEYLVAQGDYRKVEVTKSDDHGEIKSELRLAETDAPITSVSGELAGLIESRDTILGGYLTKLNDFTRLTMNEFNKVFSSGQGLTGYSKVTSEFAVDNVQKPLDEAGLKFTPTNGGFQVKVYNKQTKLTTTHDIHVDLDGLNSDTTLESLTSQLDAIDGISARITSTRNLEITSDSQNDTFGFADDTSGVLSALGINTFFSGDSATNISINSVIKSDPGKFAASAGGVGEDSKNAVKLASLLSSPLASQNGDTLAVLYDRFTSAVAQGSAVTKSLTEGYRTFKSALEGQHEAVSGVNLDEEAVKMIAFQRMFQASARFISTISDMLDILVKL